MCWDQTESNCYGSSLNGRGPHNCTYTDLLGQEHMVGTSMVPLGFIPTLKKTGGAHMIFRGTCWDQMEPNCYGSSLNGRGPHNCKYTDLLGWEHLVGTSMDTLGSILPLKMTGGAHTIFQRHTLGTDGT